MVMNMIFSGNAGLPCLHSHCSERWRQRSLLCACLPSVIAYLQGCLQSQSVCLEHLSLAACCLLLQNVLHRGILMHQGRCSPHHPKKP